MIVEKSNIYLKKKDKYKQINLTKGIKPKTRKHNIKRWHTLARNVKAKTCKTRPWRISMQQSTHNIII